MKKKRRPQIPQPDVPTVNSPQWELLNDHACGIDIGASEHWVCVPEGSASESVRAFGCFTVELEQLADWLTECGIETVAMESTGVYWLPLFQILERRGFEVKLVNSRLMKTVPGRKSDILDCQWIQRLHSYGLLSGSFRPDDQVCVLRSYIRQRQRLQEGRSTHIQRMQKALSEMNVQLHRVLSDITGVTGMSIIRAIVSGERNPQTLAQLKDRRVLKSQDTIAAALSGDYRDEHVFVLQQELSLYDAYGSQLSQCDQQIEQCLNQFVDAAESMLPLPTRPKGKKPSRNAPSFDLRQQLYRIAGVDFTAIEGLEVLTVQTILSEVGLDPQRFPSAKHFAAWLGLAPGTRISGGKSLGGSTRKVVNRAAQAFRLAAQAVGNSHSALGAFYRRLRSRLGAPKAITATAHKLARLFYRLWTTKEAFVDQGADVYEQKYQERVLRNLKKRASEMGFELISRPSQAEVS